MSSTARLKENDGHLGSKIIPDWLSRDEIQNGNLIHLFSSFLFLAFFPPYISAEENTQNSSNAIKGLPPLWLWPQNASVCWTFNQIFTRTKTKKKEDIYPLGWEASPLRCSHLNSSGFFDLSELNAESQSSDFN